MGTGRGADRDRARRRGHRALSVGGCGRRRDAAGAAVARRRIADGRQRLWPDAEPVRRPAQADGDCDALLRSNDRRRHRRYDRRT